MNKQGKIVVFGSYVADLTSRAKSLPKPGETVLGTDFQPGPGGKGSNQGVAAHRCGADVTLVTKVGDDSFGKMALDFYQKEGMNTDYILVDKEKATGVALIMVDEIHAQNMITIVGGACQNITPQEVERCRGLIEGASIVLFQHEINLDAHYAAIRMAHQAGATVVLNPAPAQEIPEEYLAMVDIITPNETEAQILTGIQVTGPESARQAAEWFFAKGVKQVVITLGAMGSYANDGEKDELLGRLQVEAVDSTGAGDAFNGGFVTALAEGKDLFGALRFANATGALSVTRKGTAPAMPSRAEVDAMVAEYYS